MSKLDASVLTNAAQQALDAAKKLGASAAEVGISQSLGLSVNAVSYTHLTLPTSDLV